MEACLNRLKEKNFHRLAFVGVLIFTVAGLVLVAVLLANEVKEEDQFRCDIKADKQTSDNLRDHCHDKYNKQFNKNFPLYGFVLLNIAVVLLVCLVYSQYVKQRVDELDNADNGDTENQGNAAPQQSRLCCKVFTAYVVHLLIRSILLALILILQWEVLYPNTFPQAFTCYDTTQKSNSTAAGLNSTPPAAKYSCKNPQARTKTNCAFALCAVNALFLGLSLLERVCLYCKAKQNQSFTEDIQFIRNYLLGKGHVNQQPTERRQSDPSNNDIRLRLLGENEQEQEQGHEQDQPRARELEQEQAREVEQKQQQPMPDPAVQTFVETTKRQILQDTENIKPLIPRSFGENENTPNLQLDDIFVKLVIQTGRKIYEFSNKARHEILDSYAEPGSSITLEKAEDLFEPNEDTQDPRTILAVGRAGIGKTILVTKILRDWANGVLSTANQAAKSFDFVFLLQFRSLNFDKGIPLMELLKRSPYSINFTDEIFQHVLRNPEKVLLVFDGLDEAKELGSIGTEEEDNNSTTEAMPVGALFAKLASGKLLNGATVLTTTRSTALPGVVSRFYSELNQKKLRHVEILGFTTERIKEYVNKFVPEGMKDDIWKHINANANLLSLCYIPVNCFIVCSNLMNILQNQEQPGATEATTHVSPTLPTTLTEIYKGALNCFMLSRHSLYRSEKPRRTEFDPNSKFRPSVEETLKKLGNMAMKGLEEGRLIFDETEIMESAQLTKEELKDMVESSLLHHLPESKTGASKYQEQYCFIHLTFQEFLAARVIAHKTPEELADFTKSAMSRNDSKMELVLQFVAGLLRGHENPDCIDSLLQSLITRWFKNVRQSQSLLLLTQCLFDFHSDDKTRQAISKFKGYDIFSFSESSVNDSGCSPLVFFFKHFSEIELDLTYCFQIGPRGCAELAKLVKDGNLKTLDIRCNNVGDEGLKSVSEALQSEECKLQILNISANGITAVGAEHLRIALTSEQCQLRELHLDMNQLTHQGAKHLRDALKSEQCQLTDLYLAENQLTDEGVIYLIDALVSGNCKLTSLNLSKVGLTNEGGIRLLKAVQRSECKLTVLHLKNNNICENLKKDFEAVLQIKREC